MAWIVPRGWVKWLVGGLVAAAVAVGVFWPRGDRAEGGAGGVWTCSMHPQIRLDHFDRCPLCGMDLTPVGAAAAVADHGLDHLQLSSHAMAMLNVATTRVEPRSLVREIRTVGKIDFDETRMAQIASRVNGRVDQVFADFPGTPVKQGDHLVSIYSPELVSTQEELLLAMGRTGDRGPVLGPGTSPLAASARRRLRLWGIDDPQIDAILASGQAETHLVVYAPIGGTVIEKMVRAGQYVKEGDPLYTIADLSHVWLLVEVYETDLPWVRFGQTVRVTIEADPAAAFTGLVGFVEPVLNEQTRTIRVRVILRNDGQKLKPGMFAEALIQVGIMPDGGPAPTGLEGKYACPMHPYVVSEGAGTCRVCSMPLEQIPGEPIPQTEPPRVLAVPAEAVLTTGRRQLVYVQHGAGIFQLVEPHLGPRAGDWYPVLHGLKEGDQVVSRGNFLLDSQFQISGKASLLYPQGMTGGGAAGHQHGATSAATAGPSTAAGPANQARAEANLARLASADRAVAAAQRTCPVTGELLGSMGVPVRLEVEGRPVYICCAGCTAAVRQDPQGTLRKLSAPAGTASPGGPSAPAATGPHPAPTGPPVHRDHVP